MKLFSFLLLFVFKLKQKEKAVYLYAIGDIIDSTTPILLFYQKHNKINIMKKQQNSTALNIKFRFILPVVLTFFLMANASALANSVKNETATAKDSVATAKKTKSIDPDKMPVLVLDGKILPKDFDTKSLHKDSIKSVVVLKIEENSKEELIAKYGQNAKNGVILITCKKNNEPSSVRAKQAGSTERGTISMDPRLMTPALVVDGKLLPNNFDTKIINKENIQSYVILTPDNGNTQEELTDKYGPNARNGVILVTSKKNDSQSAIQTPQNTDTLCDKTYTVVEMMPLFPGGEKKLKEFIKNNLIYPEAAKQHKIQGRVYVRFVITKNGTIERSEIIKGIDPECDKEALRIVNSMPFFMPGRQNGVNICVHYILPITFE